MTQPAATPRGSGLRRAWSADSWIACYDQSFPGKDDLVKQLASAEVRPIDDEGSLQFRIRGGSPAVVIGRIPVEAELEDSDGVPIFLLLHVIDGYLNELEIYRGDSLPIKGAIRPEELRTVVL